MQPIYVTLSSTGSSPWKVPNWHISPQQISFAVISGGSSYSISVTLEDPTGTYPSPVSSSPTPFTIFTGSSNALFAVGSSITAPINPPIAGYQFSLNSASTIGATPVTFIVLQSGIG